MLLTEKERLDNAVGELSLNSLNGVIAYATGIENMAYTLFVDTCPLNSLNGVIAYATKYIKR